MLKEREEQIREDYDKVLASKLAGEVSVCLCVFTLVREWLVVLPVCWSMLCVKGVVWWLIESVVYVVAYTVKPPNTDPSITETSTVPNHSL